MKISHLALLLLVLVSYTSCKSNKLSEEFKCSSPSFSNLEEITDFKKNFVMKLPKNWKTNLYYDEMVSSIYTADTTFQYCRKDFASTFYRLSCIRFPVI